MNQEQLVAKMEAYFKGALEPLRQEFGDLPACPFIRRERLADQILYIQAEMRSATPTEDLVRIVRAFRSRSTKHKTLLIVDTEKRISVEDLVELGVRLCEECRKERMIAIGVHPDDPFEIDGYKTREIPFVTMLCQEAEYISWAKGELKKSNYYAKWAKVALNYNAVQIGQFLASCE